MTRKRIAILLVVAVLVAMAVSTRGFGLAGAGGDAPLRPKPRSLRRARSLQGSPTAIAPPRRGV